VTAIPSANGRTWAQTTTGTYATTPRREAHRPSRLLGPREDGPRARAPAGSRAMNRTSSTPSGAPIAWLALGLLAASACDCGGDGGIAKIAPDLVATPNPLSFGQAFLGLTAGRTLTLRNGGTAELVVTSVRVKPGSHPGLGVEALEATIAPAGERGVTVRLTVDTVGPASGAILIASNDPDTPELEVPVVAEGAPRPGPALSVCVESADLVLARTCVDPLRVDFGAIPTGATRRAKVTLTNVGTEALTIDSAAPEAGSAPAFVMSPTPFTGVLEPGAAHVVDVAVTPTSEGEITAVLKVLSQDPERELVTVPMTANGTLAALCASPTALDFGVVAVGGEARRAVRLRSCGAAPVTLTEVAIASGAEFRLARTATVPVTLAPGDAVELELAYAPTDRGVDVGRLRARAGAGEVQLPLNGRTASCDAQVIPAAASFGTVARGMSASRNVLVENVGEEACAIASFTLAGSPEFTQPTPPRTPLVIAPGASQTLQLTYTPADAGSDRGTLILDVDDPAEPLLRVALDGARAEPGDCMLTANPSPVAFGAVGLGQRASRRVTITNSGGSRCAIAKVEMQRASSGDFVSTGQPALPFLAAGRSFDVDIIFQPRAPGMQTSALEITTSLLPSAMPTTSIPVTGTAAGPRLCITPAPVVFGTRPPMQGTTRTVTLTSCGTAPLDVTRIELPAPTSGEYTLVSPPATPLTLAAGAQAQLTLSYRPVDGGRDDGILRVRSSDGIDPTQDVQLIAAAGTACGDIQGRICGLGGSGPVAGARVTVQTPRGPVNATTDARGDYVLTCVPAGNASVIATSGSWSTTFNATVVDGQVTQLAGQQCLNPQSARVAVVYGQYDQIEDILRRLNVPYDYFDEMDQGQLILDRQTLLTYDVVFLNCGFADSMVYAGAGLQNLRDFVAQGGSLYASDWAYDAVEVVWPNAVDFHGDDTIRDAAQNAGNFSNLVDVVEPTLRTALGGRQQVRIDSCCTAIDAAGPGTTEFLAGDRLRNGTRHPFFVEFTPATGAGRVMYTDFHNTGQQDIEAIFRWLISRL
jgi:hypothetical protein